MRPEPVVVVAVGMTVSAAVQAATKPAGKDVERMTFSVAAEAATGPAGKNVGRIFQFDVSSWPTDLQRLAVNHPENGTERRTPSEQAFFTSAVGAHSHPPVGFFFCLSIGRVRDISRFRASRLDLSFEL
jgi:hypothetical protein